MRSKSTAAAALLLLLLAAVPAVLAVTFQVGDSSRWDSGVEYTAWVSGKTFRVGDTLEFKYGPSHSVSVVDKRDYDRCDTSRATQSFSGGDTKINLTKVGPIHFICPTPGHCLSGMKLAVLVLAAPVSSGPSPSPSLGKVENAKNSASKGITSYGKVSVMMVLMYVVMR